jgi:4-amino-4-deoxychorismate lyase
MAPSETRLPLLDAEGALAALRALRERQPVRFAAFYSSQLGGIVTDPALMVLPFDDHIVHRGHGVFDTAGLVAGKIYDLEAHLDRFLGSAERSKLELAGSREAMRAIIIQTAAASGVRDGAIRYWLSSGPGNLDLVPAANAAPGFFVMVFGGLAYPERWYTAGLRVMTTTYPIKPPLYAITKATNYLPNVLMQMEARAAGLDNGVSIDEAGNVGESSNMNVAFVTRDGVLRHPTFERVLPGCTSLRVLHLARSIVGHGVLTGVEVCDVPVEEGRTAREMLLLGSSVKVAPIVEWDGRPIGDGKPGAAARALLQLLEADMRSGDKLIEVPYATAPPVAV